MSNLLYLPPKINPIDFNPVGLNFAAERRSSLGLLDTGCVKGNWSHCGSRY